MMEKAVYEIDGRDFSTLEEFYEIISRILIPGAEWGQNLDAFNDILRGGFGTPEGGFIIRWKNSELSRIRLESPEEIRKHGPKMFDCLVDIIWTHCKGGPEENDGVKLVLE